MASAALRGDVVYTSDVEDLQRFQAFFPGPHLRELAHDLPQDGLRRIRDRDDHDRDARAAAAFDEGGPAAARALDLHEELADVGLDDDVDAGVVLLLRGLAEGRDPLRARRERGDRRPSVRPVALLVGILRLASTHRADAS
jgi:hypothetical protein